MQQTAPQQITSNSSPDNQALIQQLDDATKNMQPLIQQAFFFGTVLSVVVAMVVIINAVHKWRVQSAVLRIDKNLMKLVESISLHNEKQSSAFVSNNPNEPNSTVENK